MKPTVKVFGVLDGHNSGDRQNWVSITELLNRTLLDDYRITYLLKHQCDMGRCDRMFGGKTPKGKQQHYSITELGRRWYGEQLEKIKDGQTREDPVS